MPFLRHVLPSAFCRILVVSGIIGGLIEPANAAMLFCNRTQGPLEAAVGYRQKLDDGDMEWVSEGWWRIEPGQCSRVFGQPLDQRFYFYYAVALTPPSKDKQPYIWSGKYEFCTDTKAFRAEGDGSCDSRGFQTKGFQQIDLGNGTKDYTLDFKEGD